MVVTFSTRCPNLRYNFVDSIGNLVHSKSTYYYNNGYTYSYSFTIGAGFSQSISLIDWNNAKLCNWSYSFSLSFKCDVVTTNCNDCSSYTTCISCVYGYFLYMNKCYTNIANCLTRSGLSCT